MNKHKELENVLSLKLTRKLYRQIVDIVEGTYVPKEPKPLDKKTERELARMRTRFQELSK